MKQYLLLTILIFLISFQVFSFGKGEEAADSDLQFAILIKKSDESWYRKEAEGFRDKCNELGVTPFIMDNRMDPNITLANLDLAIEKNIDGAAIIIPERRMGPVIVNRAFESNMTIVSIDHKLLDHQGRQLAPHLGVDDGAAGYSIGVWLAGEIQSLEWYNSVSELAGIAVLSNEDIAEYEIRVNECQRALFEWLPDLKKANLFSVECSGSDAVGGLLAMQELLNVHPQITNWIVISANDESGIGAVRALEQVGLGSRAIACGIQAERSFREFANNRDSAFRGAVYFDPYELGGTAAEALYGFIVNETAIPAATSVPFKIITPENYEGK